MKKFIIILLLILIVLNGCEYPRKDSIYCSDCKKDCLPDGIEFNTILVWFDGELLISDEYEGSRWRNIPIYVNGSFHNLTIFTDKTFVRIGREVDPIHK